MTFLLDSGEVPAPPGTFVLVPRATGTGSATPATSRCE